MKKDHEISMAHSQLNKTVENIKKLRKSLGKKEKNIPAWVQAKITDTEHNIDAASGYMDEAKKCWKGYKKQGTQKLFGKTYNRCVKASYEVEGDILDEKRDGKSAKDPGYSLKDWFSGGGWVQTGGKYDGKPCAKQPGQKTKPFCRDADDRAAMSKDQRNKRAAKKRKEDPNPNRTGKAKVVTEKKDACYHKVKSRYKVWPSAYASGALVKCREKGAANWGNKSEGISFQEFQEKALKCWKGCRRVPGTTPGAKGSCTCESMEETNEGAAWTKKAGKNSEGGLNEKGRKSYERENPGSDLKAPSKKVGNPRRASFCARMKGMRKRQKPSNNTGDDRLSKSLRAWNC